MTTVAAVSSAQGSQTATLAAERSHRVAEARFEEAPPHQDMVFMTLRNHRMQRMVADAMVDFSRAMDEAFAAAGRDT